MGTRQSPNTPEPDVARLFHQASSHERARPIEPSIDPYGQPMRFRTYPGSRRTKLPGRDFALDMTLGAALERRRSLRDLTLSPMPIETVGRLLHTCYGVRGHRKIGGEWSYDRPAPSAGGRYPLELYVATREVQGLADGIYHYDARAHELELVREGKAEPAFGDLAIGQEVLDSANLAIVVTAVRDRTMWKYGQRGYRYVWIDAGHVGQNIYLVATAMGLGPTAIGGFFDREVSALLSLPRDEEAIYLIAVGQPTPDREENT